MCELPDASTKRPNIKPATLRDILEQGDLNTAILTDAEGPLLGLARRAGLPASDEE